MTRRAFEAFVPTVDALVALGPSDESWVASGAVEAYEDAGAAELLDAIPHMSGGGDAVDENENDNVVELRDAIPGSPGPSTFIPDVVVFGGG